MDRADTTYRDAPALAPTILISRLERAAPRDREAASTESGRTAYATHPDLSPSATHG